jgi:hypothetical protein
VIVAAYATSILAIERLFAIVKPEADDVELVRLALDLVRRLAGHKMDKGC